MKLPNVTGFHIKITAMVCMFLDHFAATILLGLINGCVHSQETALLAWVAANRNTLIDLYYLLRNIGRVSFPLYCFLLAEGFLRTRSRAKYALRLALFALVSEIPFDLAFNKSLLEFSYNNVFFTLLLGLLLIWGISRSGDLCRHLADKLPKPVCALLWAGMTGILGLACCLTASRVLHTDYAATGVATIALMYLLRKWPAASFALSVLLLTVRLDSSEIYAMLALPLAALYRGRKGGSLKFFFYIFYPAHLLLLALITRALV